VNQVKFPPKSRPDLGSRALGIGRWWSVNPGSILVRLIWLMDGG
jgi:hypothetical protein